jgi:hypothetical protein
MIGRAVGKHYLLFTGGERIVKSAPDAYFTARQKTGA